MSASQGWIDPELEAAASGLPTVSFSDVERARAQLGELIRVRPARPVPAELDVEDTVVPGLLDQPDVRVRLIRRRGPSRPRTAMVWLHGGGFILGDLAFDSLASLRFAMATDLVIVHVDYRLAPEDPYPAALIDSWSALRWVREHGKDLGVDPARVALGGTSAGGGLAAGLSLLLRDRGEPPPPLVLLQHPAVDPGMTMPSVRERSAATLRPEMVADMWAHYLSGDSDPMLDVGYASPLSARSLEGFPRTHLVTADHDPLRDEGVELGRRLIRAGVSVEVHHFPGTYHGFMSTPAAIAERAFREQVDLLNSL